MELGLNRLKVNNRHEAQTPKIQCKPQLLNGTTLHVCRHSSNITERKLAEPDKRPRLRTL